MSQKSYYNQEVLPVYFGKIYDGRFSGKLIDRNGLTADLFHENGIEVFTDETWMKE